METNSGYTPGPSLWDDYEMLNEVAKDPHGRRSRLWRRKDSGKLITENEINEATETYRPALNFARRQDKLGCLMITLFRGRQTGFIASVGGILFVPFMLLYLGYSLAMIRWDKWRAGPPKSE